MKKFKNSRLSTDSRKLETLALKVAEGKKAYYKRDNGVSTFSSFRDTASKGQCILQLLIMTKATQFKFKVARQTVFFISCF